MINMNIGKGHIRVSHNIDSFEQLATELLNGRDMIISDKVLSQSGLSTRKCVPRFGFS